METNDKLNLQNDKDIEKLIPFDKGKFLTYQNFIEPILFSDKVYKINRWNIKQERTICLTVKKVYLFRKKCIISFLNNPI